MEKDVDRKASVMVGTTKLLAELAAKAFYGEVLLKFEAGEIKLVRKTENIKL